MSNKTFNISTDQVECTAPLAHRDLQLGLSPGSHYINSSLSPSPDSSSSMSNLSEREDNSSPDINMVDCGVIEGFPVDNQQPHTDSLCGLRTNLNQTYTASPVNDSVNFWNENLSLMSNHEIGSEEYETLSKNTENGSNSLIMSPDSAGSEGILGSCETSRRGSIENDGFSLCSGEMVVRSNSFCLEDQSLLLVSSLEDSSIMQTMGQPILPGESKMSITYIGEKCIEKINEEDTSHPCLGMSFTQAELPTQNDPISDSFVALPSESEGGPLMTFICEPSPADFGEEASFKGAEAELLNLPEAFTPGPGETFVLSVSPLLGTDNIHTSTPVQTIGNDALSFPSPAESPCVGNSCSINILPDKQQLSVTPKENVFTEPTPSASKVKRMGIKKFPKSDFSNVKSKVVTRNVHQMSASGPASKQRQSLILNRKHTDAHRGASLQVNPTKRRSDSAVLSTTAKMANDAERKVNKGAASLGITVMMESSLHTAADRQNKTVGSTSRPLPSANTQISGVQCSKSCSVTEHTALSQVADTAAQPVGNQTICFSSLEKSLDGSDQTDPKQTPKKDIPSKIEVRSGSALGQDKPLVLKTQPRCSSESSSSSSWLLKEKRATFRNSTGFTFAKVDTRLGKTKPGNLNRSSQNKKAAPAETTHGPNENFRRAVKINLVEESGESARLDECKSRFRGQTSSRQIKGSPRSQPSTVSPHPSTRQRQTTLGRDECSSSKTARTPQSNQKSITGSQRVQATGGPTLGTALAAASKPQLTGLRPPQTPARPSHAGAPPTPASRLKHKPLGPFRSQTEANVHTGTEAAVSTQVSGGATRKQTPFRAVLLKSRFTTTPVKNTGPALAAACKPSASIGKGASNSTVSQLKRAVSARLTSAGPVDKNKPKAGSNHQQQRPQPQPTQPNQSHGRPDVVPARVPEVTKQDQGIQQLRGLLTASNCRFEAVAIVLQQTLAERDEATRHCRDLSQELVNLRGELVCSLHSSELLQKEKDELRVALEDALQKVQEQHQKDLAELEQRLQTFYQTEWDKVQMTYQEEADKCKTLMQQQMEELKANHEAMKLVLENSHTEQLASVKQQCEMSLEELRKVHNEELQSLDKALKDAEAALSGQIEELTVENNALIEKLSAEEGRRKALAENSQKDSHTLYLEQELESLKVVLDIKNKQLHQQEKQLMEIEKLKEKNLKLDENFRKVQQENEDFKARMDRHAALSRQLSTEQAVLQESLQKESKVNKRLSMENEELLWKLHNGDLSSPRKLSPSSTSPSHSFSLQSPRSSGLFSSPPVSPR